MPVRASSTQKLLPVGAAVDQDVGRARAFAFALVGVVPLCLLLLLVGVRVAGRRLPLNHQQPAVSFHDSLVLSVRREVRCLEDVILRGGPSDTVLAIGSRRTHVVDFLAGGLAVVVLGQDEHSLLVTYLLACVRAVGAVPSLCRLRGDRCLRRGDGVRHLLREVLRYLVAQLALLCLGLQESFAALQVGVLPTPALSGRGLALACCPWTPHVRWVVPLSLAEGGVVLLCCLRLAGLGQEEGIFRLTEGLRFASAGPRRAQHRCSQEVHLLVVVRVLLPVTNACSVLGAARVGSVLLGLLLRVLDHAELLGEGQRGRQGRLVTHCKVVVVPSGQGVLSVSSRRSYVDHSPEVRLALRGKLVGLLSGGVFVVLGLILQILAAVGQGQSAALVHLLGRLWIAPGAEVVPLSARVRYRCTHLLRLWVVDRAVGVAWAPVLAELALALHPPVLPLAIFLHVQRDKAAVDTRLRVCKRLTVRGELGRLRW